MKKTILFFVCALTLAYTNAQNKVGGEWSIGPRFGGATGLSLKNHSTSNKSAIEIIGANSFDHKLDGFTITGLYEKLSPMIDNAQLCALLGGGVNFNFGDRYLKVGFSGVLGFDWRLKAIPLSMQVDWMPTLFLTDKLPFSGINGAFTIRYIMNRKPLYRPTQQK